MICWVEKKYKDRKTTKVDEDKVAQIELQEDKN